MNPTGHQPQRNHDSSSKNPWSPQSIIKIRGRRYLIQQQLGKWYRPRYLAWDVSSRRACLLLRLQPGDVSRQHLGVLRRVGSRHGLPSILDQQTVADELRIVTTYQPGVDLQQYLRMVQQQRVVAPSAYESVRLIRGLAHGLWQLHRYAQLIHGDLKPANLIITRKPAHLHLIDFGSAWQIERATSSDPGDGCEPIYTAPEFLRMVNSHTPEQVDARADQFSAMVILYQLVTGVIPYEGLGGQAGLPQFYQHADLSLVLPSKLSKTVQHLPRQLRQQLDTVMQTGLSLDPQQRYPTTSAWVDDLEALYLRMRCHRLEYDSGRWQQIIDRLAGIFSLHTIKQLFHTSTDSADPHLTQEAFNHE